MTKLGVLFSVLGVGAGCIPAFAQKQLPNIIVMLSDDQGWGDLGFTGNTFVQTPNKIVSLMRERFWRIFMSVRCHPRRGRSS